MNTQYIEETIKSPAQAVTDLQASVKQHGYGVLDIYDLKETLASKGFDLPNACHILEVCNPRQAAAVLAAALLNNYETNIPNTHSSPVHPIIRSTRPVGGTASYRARLRR